MLLNEDDVQEAVQDAFLAVWNQSRDFNGNSTVKTWVTGIAINKALMLLRKRTGREVTFEWNDSEVAAPVSMGRRIPKAIALRLSEGLHSNSVWTHCQGCFERSFSLRMRGLASPEVADLVSIPRKPCVPGCTRLRD